MKGRYIFLLVLGLLVWLWQRPDAQAHWSGRPAPNVPLQSGEKLPPAWRQGDYTFTPLAHFDVQAVVLSRERYRIDQGAKLAPIDLALGWGRMSEAEVINALSISQDHRWYNYRWPDEPPIPAIEIARSSANMHLIPANDRVRSDVLKIQRHERVHLTGYLVEITRPDGWHWRSSLSRDDTGGGACEVIWVESAQSSPLEN